MRDWCPLLKKVRKRCILFVQCELINIHMCYSFWSQNNYENGNLIIIIINNVTLDLTTQKQRRDDQLPDLTASS